MTLYNVIVVLSGLWHRAVAAVITWQFVSAAGEQYTLRVDSGPARVWHRHAQTARSHQLW